MIQLGILRNNFCLLWRYQMGVERDFKVLCGENSIVISTSDDELFMSLASKMRSCFERSIGSKQKIIAFYNVNELVQRRYFLKLISKIFERINSTSLDFTNSQNADIKLVFKKANSIKILINLPMYFDKNSVIFDVKFADNLLKKYLVKMIGAKHDGLSHILRFIIGDASELERLSDIISFKEHLNYTLNFIYDQKAYGEFCKIIGTIDSCAYKRRFTMLASLLEEHFIMLGCNLDDGFETVRANYLHLSKLYHPDSANKLNADNAKLREKFQEINFAYEALKPYFAEQDKIFKGIA